MKKSYFMTGIFFVI